jgi:5'-deoxynucleotidase YfbR-like HD superfamily hydrolase
MTPQNIETFNPPLEQRVEGLSKLSELYSAFMRIERATQRDGRPETDGEHTIHEMFLAVAYAARYHPELNPGEIALFMMIHDLDEVYVGDVNSLTADDQAMHQKERSEEESRRQLRLELTEEPFILDLLERYWRQEEFVVKFVRAIEKIGPSFAHQRDSGDAIRAMGIQTPEQYHELNERSIERMKEYATPDVVGVRRLLGQEVMKAAFGVV